MSGDAVDVAPMARAHGTVRVPGDKSASHRALLLSALAEGESTVTGASPGRDVAATRRAVEQLGARVEGGSTLSVYGPAEGLRPAAHPLDCENSGTTMRLLAGVLAAVAGRHELVGDASLSRRPMDRVAVPLETMGARVRGQGPRRSAPLTIDGRRPLRAITYRVPVPSAQVKSAVLLAALGADGPCEVDEPVRTRTTTEDMLVESGVTIAIDESGPGRVVRVEPGRPLARAWAVPADPSQAAFFAVLGVVHRDALVQLTELERRTERVGFVDVLVRMGGRVTWAESASSPGRSTLVAASSELTGTEVHGDEIPSLDEVPALVVAAAAARGVSAFRDMAELRVKESDRFAASLDLARALGCVSWADGDDFFVEGVGSASAFASFDVAASLDHRVVMASAVAGAAGAGCRIVGVSTVATSYPHFFEDLASLR
ncbi:MAG: 3-phosphoshikimate 1-carboxyvinyltransferase [Acidimicrobiales bacterium]